MSLEYGYKDREGRSPSEPLDPLRTSLEEAYRSSSEEELDELDPLQDKKGRFSDSNGRYRKRSSKAKGLNLDYQNEKRNTPVTASRKVLYSLRPRKRCLVAVFAVLAVVVALLGGGGFWAYKKAPKGGVINAN